MYIFLKLRMTDAIIATSIQLPDLKKTQPESSRRFDKIYDQKLSL